MKRRTLLGSVLAGAALLAFVAAPAKAHHMDVEGEQDCTGARVIFHAPDESWAQGQTVKVLVELDGNAESFELMPGETHVADFPGFTDAGTATWSAVWTNRTRNSGLVGFEGAGDCTPPTTQPPPTTTPPTTIPPTTEPPTTTEPPVTTTDPPSTTAPKPPAPKPPFKAPRKLGDPQPTPEEEKKNKLPFTGGDSDDDAGALLW